MNTDTLSIKPTHEYIILEDCEAPKVSSGGIYLQGGGDAPKQQYAYVVSVGEGVLSKDGSTLIIPTVKIGDKVLYLTDSVTNTKIDGRDVVITRESNIMAVVE